MQEEEDEKEKNVEEQEDEENEERDAPLRRASVQASTMRAYAGFPSPPFPCTAQGVRLQRAMALSRDDEP